MNHPAFNYLACLKCDTGSLETRGEVIVSGGRVWDAKLTCRQCGFDLLFEDGVVTFAINKTPQEKKMEEAWGSLTEITPEVLAKIPLRAEQREKVKNTIFQMLNNYAADTVIDFGIGDDLTVFERFQAAKLCVGIDINLKVLKKLSGILSEDGYSNAVLIHAAGRSLPLRRNAWDLIVARSILQHLTPPELYVTVANLHSLLVPKGVLITANLNYDLIDRWKGREAVYIAGNKTYCRKFTIPELKELFSKKWRRRGMEPIILTRARLGLFNRVVNPLFGRVLKFLSWTVAHTFVLKVEKR